MTSDHIIFNRQRVRQHRDRAAPIIHAHDFLLREVAERLCERLEDFTRTFPVALDLGAHHGILASVLNGRGGIETLVQTDLSASMLSRAKGLRVIADEEFLPFADNSFDAILSVGALHWTNDLPGALVQIRRALKPDGLFMAVLPGGETLRELREALTKAEIVSAGGASPRVSPFIDVRDGGALLQRAGFSMPVADSELLSVVYEDPLSLLHDLCGMGEANALVTAPTHPTRREVFSHAFEYYERKTDGLFPATFELVTLTGWKARDSALGMRD